MYFPMVWMMAWGFWCHPLKFPITYSRTWSSLVQHHHHCLSPWWSPPQLINLRFWLPHGFLFLLNNWSFWIPAIWPVCLLLFIPFCCVLWYLAGDLGLTAKACDIVVCITICIMFFKQTWLFKPYFKFFHKLHKNANILIWFSWCCL